MPKMDYSDEQRDRDFDFFVSHYDEIFKKHGRCYAAIKNGIIIGVFHSIKEAFASLEGKYERGSYILQECTGKASAYQTRIARAYI